jgi:hypothetical protein
MSVSCRNTELTHVALNQSLSANFTSQIIDFKEMNVAFIQAVVTTPPDAYDGQFTIKVSLLCDPTTFVHFPDSERTLNASCNNFGWTFCCVPFRYALISYTKGSVTSGIVDLYARAKLS